MNYLPCIWLPLYRVASLRSLKQDLGENQLQIFGLLAQNQDSQDFGTRFYHTRHALQQSLVN
jgi:hypothetical protein